MCSMYVEIAVSKDWKAISTVTDFHGVLFTE